MAPGFRALSIVATRTDTGIGDEAVLTEVRVAALAAAQAGAPAWAGTHLADWADVFRRFGAKPQRTPCSAQALRDRVLKSGEFPELDPVVDLYNAISIKYAVPVGGENMLAYQGSPRLVVADGSESFDTMKNGAPAVECPERGEVVWRDDVGVTCRRWNWRQGVRTRLDVKATAMWFVLESLPTMPLEALEQAGDELMTGLRSMFGSIRFQQALLQKEGA
ncbi:MAG: phenylalanine--tRNA ligase beta subunit-related protein [Hyphomicrobiales bacterium]